MGICIIRCCRVLLKEDGSLATPVINWMDKRLNSAYEWKEEYGKVAYVTTSSGYISNRLTGAFKDTCANYIGSWPIDNTNLIWSSDDSDFEKHNLKRNEGFELVKPGEVLGQLKEDLVSELGLNSSIPVIATAHDKAVEALGAGSLEKGSVLISLGTYIGAMLHGESHIENSSNFWSFQSAVAGQYLYECMGVRRGMWTVSWFCDQFSTGLIEQLQKRGLKIEDYFNEGASNVPAGCEGLITVHDWAPPANAEYRKGIMLGFDGRHNKFHIYRSILEGIAFTMKNHVDKMLEELSIDLNKLVISGGGANSDLFMQIFSDVFGVEAVRNKIRGSASIGSAINAAMAVGAFESYDKAVESMVKGEVFKPISENYQLYSLLNENVYKKTETQFDPILKSLAKIVD